MSTFIQILFSSLESGSIFALAALGIIIIFKTSTIANFAQGAMGMINAFVAATILLDYGVPPWVAMLIAIVSSVIASAIASANASGMGSARKATESSRT